MSETPSAGAAARREARVRSEAPAEIVLLRHGEPDWTPGNRSTNDPPLTERGRSEAASAGRALASLDFDAIYVSPLQRAQQTAEPLAKETGLTPVTVDGLAEIGLSLEGLTQSEVDSYFQRAMRRPLRHHWDGWPDGESFREFHARVTSTVEQLLSRHGMPTESVDDFTVWHVPTNQQRIAIVAHGGTNAVAITHLLDLPPVPWEWTRFEFRLGCYAVLRGRPLGMTGFTWSLGSFNQVSHLEEAGLL